MTTDWLSGGFIIALAAVLWLVYLVPSWFRSRQYLATERNAVRLQQTLRILAETAEVPEEVRIEANARSIAEQERILKHRAAEREARAVPAAVVAADRLRRSRAVTAVVLALSLVVAVLGGVQLAANGTWLLIVAGAGVAVVCVLMLARLAKAGRRLRVPLPAEYLVADSDAARLRAVPAAGDATRLYDELPADDDAEAMGASDAGTSTAPAADGWVPVAVPRPLYLSRAGLAPLSAADDGAGSAPAAAPAAESTGIPAADVDHETELRAAAADAEAALRERMRAELETIAELGALSADEPPSQEPAPAAPPSRFAAMGILDDAPSASLDLDAVLARRRAG